MYTPVRDLHTAFNLGVRVMEISKSELPSNEIQYILIHLIKLILKIQLAVIMQYMP
jgi:hypothetical protein